jgi:glutamate-ammonia-ligase adenylyltransferase
MASTEEFHSLDSSLEALYQRLGVLAAEASLSPRAVVNQVRRVLRTTPHPRRGLVNLHRYLAAGFASATLREFLAHPFLLDTAAQIFSQSQFLADILVRHPELLTWLTSPDVLRRAKSKEELTRDALDAVIVFQRLERKLDSLKRLQRRELLRIGTRAILGEANVQQTSSELAALADVIVGTVLELGERYFYETVGIERRGEFTVIGLGKLGGGELNFSSDIDLMFVYDRDEEWSTNFGRIGSSFEYYNRLAEFVIRRLSEHTNEGHLYRVDMRLRPEGKSGPLALPISGYLSYYETRGELWERQMLLKARIVAGNEEVGERWLRTLEPFIYPKSLMGSPFEEIARIKAKIEDYLRGEENVKLGSGGIRDIEFIVQALQMAHAGSRHELRQQSTLSGISTLAAAGILNDEEDRLLASAYRFLRTVEDRLQLLHGLQKHSLPESAEEKAVLARQLGFSSAKTFERTLQKHRCGVRQLFDVLFHGGSDRGDKKDVSVESTEQLLSPPALRRLGFKEPEQTAEALVSIARELEELRVSKRLRSFVELCRQFGAGDWAVRNFLHLATSTPIRRTLAQSVRHAKLLELLIVICSRSSKLSELLAQEPLLFETLVGRTEEVLAPPRGWEFFQENDLLRLRKYNEFKYILRWLMGLDDLPTMLANLSSLAEYVVKRSGESIDEEVGLTQKGVLFAFVALGKFGGREITIGSDLDLIFVYEGRGDESAKRSNRAVQRFIDQVGGVYEVDFRLRPEGKSSPLATDFIYYRDYLRSRASLWELQSLQKARMVGGDSGFGRRILQMFRDEIVRRGLPDGWTREIRQMKKKIEKERSGERTRSNLKTSRGGLIDIEFALQSIALWKCARGADEFPPNSFEQLDEFNRLRLLTQAEVRDLRRRLTVFRSLETLIRINAESNEFVVPADSLRAQAIAAGLGLGSAKRLKELVRRFQKENRAFLLKTLRRLKSSSQ